MSFFQKLLRFFGFFCTLTTLTLSSSSAPVSLFLFRPLFDGFFSFSATGLGFDPNNVDCFGPEVEVEAVAPFASMPFDASTRLKNEPVFLRPAEWVAVGFAKGLEGPARAEAAGTEDEEDALGGWTLFAKGLPKSQIDSVFD